MGSMREGGYPGDISDRPKPICSQDPATLVDGHSTGRCQPHAKHFESEVRRARSAARRRYEPLHRNSFTARQLKPAAAIPTHGVDYLRVELQSNAKLGEHPRQRLGPFGLFVRYEAAVPLNDGDACAKRCQQEGQLAAHRSAP